MIRQPCPNCQGEGVVQDIFTDHDRRLVQLLRFATRYWGVRWQDILGPRRYKPLTHARFWLAATLRYDDGWSLKEIAMYLGERDHATIHHAIQRAVALGLHAGGPKIRVA